MKLTVPSLRSMEPSEVLYVHVLKRCVQYLLLPYLSVDIILCAIGHGQEELQYVDSNTWTLIRGLGNIFITSFFLLSQFFDILIAVDEKFSISPSGIESTFPLEAQEAIHNIQKVCCRDRYRGFLVVSRSWLRDTGGTAIDSVICDVLLISRNMGGLHLYTICDAADEESMKYSKKAAQSIKKKLSENGARGQKFYVSYHVLPCGAGGVVGLPVPDDRYPKSYDLLTPREKLNEILKGMVITVAAVPSTLSSKLGVTIFNLLTTEQFRLVHQQIEVNRELWIKGVAGTGKTLVAVEFMRELRRREKLQRDEILYVCENEGIASQVR